MNIRYAADSAREEVGVGGGKGKEISSGVKQRVMGGQAAGTRNEQKKKQE